VQLNRLDIKTESLAIAPYFADMEDFDVIRTTCIDMGEDTSDFTGFNIMSH